MFQKLNSVSLAILISLGVSSVEAKVADITYPNKDSALYKQNTGPSEFLHLNAKSLKLRADINDLVLVKVKESLTAKHYHFKQTFNNIDVHLGEVIVSVDNAGNITHVFNNTYEPKEALVSNRAIISSRSALEQSWAYLQATGDLNSKPKSKLVYADINGKLELVYLTQIGINQPRGAWQQMVSAISGEVLSTTRIDLPNKVNANAGMDNDQWPRFNPNKQFVPLEIALKKLQERSSATRKSSKLSLKASGSALIFDPNPVMALRNDTLQDNSPASAFDAAYETKTLLDIKQEGGVFKLEGPWVNIQNFENPATAPSTTMDGNWTAKRGDNSFNDANTYYHLDSSQRYIQSLGFTGSKGIQEVSINVDTDGWDGQDNSSFSPGANQLSFGHGCVDDNEDSDVIFHEYGHAINFSISSNWRGGDTGAMGEGFGDYWAGSYRQSTTNADFHPEWVFSWDGHNNCWGGRVMNQTNFSYDPTKTYGAHQFVNGQNGDELWSTPLFQSLMQLIAQGRTREEVDTIILEGHFGLGANLKMPDLANSIIAAAERLHPTGPHAAVFRANFEQVKILTASTSNGAPVVSVAQTSISVIEGSTVTLDASSSNDPDGDSLTFSWRQTSGPTVTLSNTTAAAPTFTAPDVSSTTTLGFEITVSDGNASASANVSVSVSNSTTTTPPPANGGDSGGGTAGFGLLALLMLAYRRRKR